MDCNNWIGCQEDCESCILMSMDQADQVQAWNVETMQQWSPEDILKLLQSFGRRAKNAEKRGLQQIKLQRQEVQKRNRYKAENDRLREALKLCCESMRIACEMAQGCPYVCSGESDCQHCIHDLAERKAREVLEEMEEKEPRS